MLGKIFKTSIAAAGLLAAGSFYAPEAEAGVVEPCDLSGGGTSSFSMTTDVTPTADGCIGPEAGNNGAESLNDITAFTFNDWDHSAKQNSDDGGFVFSTEFDDGFSLTITATQPNNATGTWSVDGGAIGDMDFVLLFKTGNIDLPDDCKDGNDTSGCEFIGPGWVAYLMDGTASSGSYDLTSWVLDGNTKLSHVSLYTRGGGGDVPEPAALGILGLGLVGLGIARRRRQKK